MRNTFIWSAILCIVLSPLLRAEVAPESDEAKFVRLTKHLEAQPLSDTDKEIRSWLLKWAIDTEEFTVVACNLLESADGEERPHDAIYTTQMIFGNAAYQIEHPDKRDDMLAMHVAAVRSALRAYASILATDPQARIPHLDALLAQDAAGELEDRLATVVAKECSDEAESEPQAEETVDLPFGESKEAAIEVCKPTGQREYLSRLVCPDSSFATFERVGNYGLRNDLPADMPEAEQEAQMRAAMVGAKPEPGKLDIHIVDGYRVSCGKEERMLYLDMYHCDVPPPKEAPRGFILD